MTREEWLRAAAEAMSPKFDQIGYPLPKFTVSIGFTSHGANKGIGGQCWSKTCTEDESFTIFIAPHVNDDEHILAILCHELIHAAVGLKEGHKGKFALVMKAWGMKRPFTSSIPDDEFKLWAAECMKTLGPLPHPRLQFIDGKTKLFKKGAGGVEKAGDDEGEGGGDEPVNNAPKKQGTRMIKCECRECGYVARTTRKWLDEKGPPHCPDHGAMKEDGNEE